MRWPVRLLVNKHSSVAVPRVGIWKGLELQKVQLQQNLSTLSFQRFVSIQKKLSLDLGQQGQNRACTIVEITQKSQQD